MKIIQLPESVSQREQYLFGEMLQSAIVSGRDMVVPFSVSIIDYGENNSWGCSFCGTFNGKGSNCVGCGSPQGRSVVIPLR